MDRDAGGGRLSLSRRLLPLVLILSTLIAAPSALGHVGQPNRHWAEHPFSTKFDYYIPFCFEDGWPGGSHGTSANNVAYGIERWNNKFVSGQEIDFRYGRMNDCDDRDDEDMVVRIRNLPSGTLGNFEHWPWDEDSSGHVTSGRLNIDNDTGNGYSIFYGGCCPAWQGSNDVRIHVQSIAAHEAGHGAILSSDLNDNEVCCEADTQPTDINWHSHHGADLMFPSLAPGQIKLPTSREIGWLDLSYPYVD